jgi:hypothetical protein
MPLFLALLCLWGLTAAVYAGAQEESLDQMLKGFETKPKEPKTGSYDSLLQGFEKKKAKTSNDSLDALEGFEKAPPMVSLKNKTPEKGLHLPQWLDVEGDFSFRSVANLDANPPNPGQTDHRGLDSLRGEISLQADVDLPHNWDFRISGDAFYDAAFSINGREDYTGPDLASGESSVEFDELWLRGALFPKLDLKLGRQIVVWGRSDNIRITDVLNPMDYREPGMTDIEDLRLPVAMTKLDYYPDKMHISAILVNEIRFNKEPAFGSNFYSAESRPPNDIKPRSHLDNTEFALSLEQNFSGWDYSLYGAYFYNDSGHLAQTNQGIAREHERLYMLGAAVNMVRGNWLFKTEAAWFEGFKFLALPQEEKSRIDLLLGVEYSGIHETTISLEAANRHMFDFDQVLENSPEKPKEDDFQWALRFSRDLLHDRLTMTFLASVFGLGLDQGGFQRLEGEYELTSHWHLIGGLVLYQSGEHRPFETAGDKDRVFVKLKYSF